MSGDGRNLVLLQSIPVVSETVLVPVISLPWRDDEQDRKPNEQERTAS